MAVLAGGQIVAVRIALGVDDFIAGQALQSDRHLKILDHRPVIGGEQSGAAEAQREEGEVEGRGTGCHRDSCSVHEMVANFAGSLRMPQIASRDATMSLASGGAVSLATGRTLSSNRSESRRSAGRGGVCPR